MSDLTEKTKIRINRDVLEKFLPNKDAIRKFEELLRTLNDLVPEDLQMLLSLIEEVQIENYANLSKINGALNLIQVINKAFEIVQSRPNIRSNRKPFVDYIDFYENGNVVDKPGRVYWKDSDDKSLNVVMNDEGVVLQVGQEQYYLAKNTTGSTIPNGSLCKFTGTVGASGKLTVGLGYGADDENVLMGVATQDIANNEFGFITHFGLIRGINTTGAPYGETWNDGDFLYPSSTVAGRLTNIRPQAPNLREPLASVIYSSSGPGSIFVRMKTGETIDHLHDVQLTSLSDGDILLYNLANQRWENSNTLSTKVDKVTLTDNAIIRSNGTSGDIQNSGITIDDSDNIVGANSIYLGGSTSANKLDDYEEGTWSPELTFGGGNTGLTYSVHEGSYTKIGRVCIGHIRLTLTNKGTSTGVIEVTLPFSVADALSTTSVQGTSQIGWTSGILTTHTDLFVHPWEGTNKFRLGIKTSSTGSTAQATDADISNAFDCRITVIFTTN